MDKIAGVAKAEIDFKIQFTLTLGEASALDALAGYGTNEFLKIFYERMGKSYLEPHETSLKNLFSNIRGTLATEIAKIEAAKKAITEALKGF